MNIWFLHIKLYCLYIILKKNKNENFIGKISACNPVQVHRKRKTFTHKNICRYISFINKRLLLAYPYLSSYGNVSFLSEKRSQISQSIFETQKIKSNSISRNWVVQKHVIMKRSFWSSAKITIMKCCRS